MVNKRAMIIFAGIAVLALIAASSDTVTATNPTATSETVTISGSIQLNLSNARLPYTRYEPWEYAVFNLTTPEGYSLNSIQLTASNYTALEHVYRGMQGTAQSSDMPAYPSEDTRYSSRACSLEVGHKIRTNTLDIFVYFNDSATVGAPSTAQFVIWDDNSGEPGVAVSTNSTDIHNWPGNVWAYRSFAFPHDNISLPNDGWIGFNASLCNDSAEGGNAFDNIWSRSYSKTGVVNSIGSYSVSGGWVVGGIFSFPAFLHALRISNDNSTWESPSAEALNLTMRGSGTGQFTGDSLVFSPTDPDNETIELRFESNSSSWVTIDWVASFGRVKDRTQPFVGVPPGRYPDHLDHKPYVPDYWPERGTRQWILWTFGWYIVFVMVPTVVLLAGIVMRNPQVVLGALIGIGVLACVWWASWVIWPEGHVGTVLFLNRSWTALVGYVSSAF